MAILKYYAFIPIVELQKECTLTTKQEDKDNCTETTVAHARQ